MSENNLSPFDSTKTIFEYLFNGRKIIFELDRLANKSDKSIMCRYGNTTVLTALTVKNLTKNVYSFFPLTVTFEERFYAVGRIPNIFGKREGKPSYDAITVARLIDRSLRSFFPLGSNQEVQITNLVLSVDQAYDPRLVALWNSFLVCFLAPNLPYFSTPFATVIIGKEAGNLICNPSQEKLNNSSLELIVSATEEKIIMLEAGAAEIVEKELEQAIELAHQEIRLLIGFFAHIAESIGVEKKKNNYHTSEKEVEKSLEEKINYQLGKVLTISNSWIEKEKKMKEIRQEITREYYAQNHHLDEEQTKDLIEKLWNDGLRNWMRQLWKEKKVRLDGRKSHEIRPLTVQIDYLPNVHGSATFTRGDTQVLSVVTLGKTSEKQLTDTILSRSYKHFIHHYNFPAFAVNEITSYRSVSRREIGHGELVEKTFDYLIPPNEIFPYTIRVVSEVLSSDGSSSQASICATSLALMATGVPLIRPAAGIALGLFEGQIYSDINGLEDKLGEMDFKISGTEHGICSIQLDVKNHGINQQLIKECLNQARQTRLYILAEMKKCISYPRSNLPIHVIKWRRIYIGIEKIGLIIGPRGKTINHLTEESGATIEVQPDGYLLIYHLIEEQLERVCRSIKKIIN